MRLALKLMLLLGTCLCVSSCMDSASATSPIIGYLLSEDDARVTLVVAVGPLDRTGEATVTQETDASITVEVDWTPSEAIQPGNVERRTIVIALPHPLGGRQIVRADGAAVPRLEAADD